MTFRTFDGTRVDSFDAQQYAAIEDEINAACIARDMTLAYAKLQERRALETHAAVPLAFSHLHRMLSS
jgi:hypothetical protein